MWRLCTVACPLNMLSEARGQGSCHRRKHVFNILARLERPSTKAHTKHKQHAQEANKGSKCLLLPAAHKLPANEKGRNGRGDATLAI